MTTLVFFFIGWGILFLLLLVLPSIFTRKVTAALAVIAGILALVMIATQTLLSWMSAIVAGSLLTVVTSILASKRISVVDDEDEGEPTVLTGPAPSSDSHEKGLSAEHEAYAAEESVEQRKDGLPGAEESEPMANEHDSWTDTEGPSDESHTPEQESPVDREADAARRFVVSPEEDEGDTDSGSSRLIEEDEETILTERRPLNEDEEEPLMRRSVPIEAEAFADDAGDLGESSAATSSTDEEAEEVNEKRKRLFEQLADEDEEEAGR